MSEAIQQQIEALRAKLGADLTIVGHHYQSDSIIKYTEITGDSLELSQKVAAISSPNIVFCGVHFMAESAALLARAGQKIFLPAADANCVMAQMVPAPLLDAVITNLIAAGHNILPIAYVNTPLAVKAVVGKHGGAVCTSANAYKVMQWALEQDKQILFLPDKNLGRNTAKALGIAPEDQQIINVRAGGSVLAAEKLNARLLLWPGQCAIHARFKVEHISALRTAHPGIKVAVHPECAPEIVNAADAAGSTSFLIRFAAEAPRGSTIAIGTESNLVNRLIAEHKDAKNILPLHVSYCSDMAKTTPEALLSCLQKIADGSAVPVKTNPAEDAHARTSLETMLEICR